MIEKFDSISKEFVIWILAVSFYWTYRQEIKSGGGVERGYDIWIKVAKFNLIEARLWNRVWGSQSSY